MLRLPQGRFVASSRREDFWDSVAFLSSTTMYLTAQRVTRLADGATAIHAFLHVHGERLGLSRDWTASDILQIANHRPGRLIARDVSSLPQGGNRVISYLDIVCEDDTAFDTIEEAFRGFRVEEVIRKQETHGPVTHNGNGVAMLFSSSWSATGYAELEFEALRSAVSRLLQRCRH